MAQTNSKMQTVFRLLCFVLILALLAITVYREIARSSDAYSFEVATLATCTKTDTLTGFVFRDEIAPDSINNGPVRYLVRAGETVSAGTLLAEVHRDDTGTDKRERAAALYAEMEALQAALDAQTNWESAYLTDYPALMQSISAEKYADASEKAMGLGNVLGGKDCEKTNAAEALCARIAAAQDELAEMVAYINDPAPIVAAIDGTFYHSADGLEHLFGANVAESLTPESLQALLKTRAQPERGVGKLVSNGKWFLAVPIHAALAETYTQGTDYTLRFEGGRCSMTLEKITLAENGEDALLLFCAASRPAFLSCSRAQRVSIEKQKITGLSLPACSLATDNAVYVIRDGAARLCPVTVLQRGKDGTLLLPEETQGALCEGDRVIVSARQLFDGKVLE